MDDFACIDAEVFVASYGEVLRVSYIEGDHGGFTEEFEAEDFCGKLGVFF